MFYKLTEYIQEVDSEGNFTRDIQDETSGVCTCGAKFLMKRNVPLPLSDTQDSTGATEATVFEQAYECCPKCGDPLGLDRRLIVQVLVGADGKVQKVERPGLPGIVLSAFIERPDGKLTILKEAVAEEDKTKWARYAKSRHYCNPKFTRYETTIGRVPAFHVEGVVIDGQPVKATKDNLNKAIGGIWIPVLNKKDYADGGLECLLSLTGKAFETECLSKAVNLLLDYPVLDAVFKKVKNAMDAEYYGNAIAGFVKNGEVKKGERSEGKAFGLPKVVCDVFWMATDLVDAKWAVKELGPKFAATAMQDIKKLGAAPGTFKKFARFYCQLKPAERQRVMEYLTHDVDVYQGIREPAAALDILLDYWWMCKDMGIAPELCPKSLKLQCDMAAKNYRRRLDETQQQKDACA